MVSVVSKNKEGRGGPTSNVKMSPTNQARLIVVVRSVDDEAVDEPLQEDGGRATARRPSSSVTEVHSRQRVREGEKSAPGECGVERKERSAPGSGDLRHVALVKGHAPDLEIKGLAGSPREHSRVGLLTRSRSAAPASLSSFQRESLLEKMPVNLKRRAIRCVNCAVSIACAGLLVTESDHHGAANGRRSELQSELYDHETETNGLNEPGERGNVDDGSRLELRRSVVESVLWMNRLISGPVRDG
jgi:hypothetical protein